jgi:hypothetical protein
MELKILLMCIEFTAIPQVLLNGQMFDRQVSLMVIIDPMNLVSSSYRLYGLIMTSGFQSVPGRRLFKHNWSKSLCFQVQPLTLYCALLILFIN